ncbi:MAG: long-chain fatty acid--CoA ligase [Burkholderiales bacterium]|jgi:fatty-acyl-CoA synthase
MTQQRHLEVWPKHLPRHLTVPATTLGYNLDVSTTRYPEKPALVFYDNQISYARLHREVEAMAGYLQHECGVSKGDRVLLDMQNCPQFIIGFFAILRADAVVVPVSPMNVTDELVHYLADSGAVTALIGQEVFKQFRNLIGTKVEHLIIATYADYLPADLDITVPVFVAEARSNSSGPGVVTWRDALAADRRPQTSRARADDLAAILYTSGTTGKPKGCMHTHRTIMTTLVGAALWEGLSTDSVALATAPFFHVTGMQHSMHAPVFAGATIVILPRWDPEVAGYMIERYGCTHWANVPTMVVDLLAHASTAARDLGSLQNIFGGGSSMPEAVAQKLFERCGIRYMEGYGMTETISQTHMNPHEDLRKQCLGIPVFDTVSTVIDPQTLKELGPGETGEIISSGPQVMQGYWQRDEANMEAFIEMDGRRFFRTGDLGRYDEHGFFYIADRLKRMINAAGYKVWPAELEATLYKHPDIKEVAIISSPDSRRGETVKAVVVPTDKARETLKAEDIIAWSREHMAAYKVPRLVSFVDALPRSGTGKIQWRTLQEREWQDVADKAAQNASSSGTATSEES